MNRKMITDTLKDLAMFWLCIITGTAIGIFAGKLITTIIEKM